MITLTPNTPQCWIHSSIKGDKSRNQFIADHHVAVQVEGIISVDMCLLKINSYSFDVNLERLLLIHVH